MPRINVVFYREAEGSVPVLEWFDELPAKAQDKSRVRIQRLAELGYELRRPEADLLRDGIYELRVGTTQHVNSWILYFFHGQIAAVLAHGLTKQTGFPRQLSKQRSRESEFEQDPKLHTFEDSSSQSEEPNNK